MFALWWKPRRRRGWADADARGARAVLFDVVELNADHLFPLGRDTDWATPSSVAASGASGSGDRCEGSAASVAASGAAGGVDEDKGEGWRRVSLSDSNDPEEGDEDSEKTSSESEAEGQEGPADDPGAASGALRGVARQSQLAGLSEEAKATLEVSVGMPPSAAFRRSGLAGALVNAALQRMGD